MCSLYGWENPYRGRSEALAVARLAESPPSCTKPHQEHMKYTYIIKSRLFFLAYVVSFNSMKPKAIIKQRDLFLYSTTRT